jgi:hypothetical protein
MIPWGYPRYSLHIQVQSIYISHVEKIEQPVPFFIFIRRNYKNIVRNRQKIQIYPGGEQMKNCFEIKEVMLDNEARFRSCPILQN